MFYGVIHMFKWSREEEQQSTPKDQNDSLSHLLGGDDQQDNKDDQQQDQNGDDQQQGSEQQSDQDNSDRQGVIRDVPGAHLVYKRKTSDNTFDELWIYNIGKTQDELQIRKAIIAGTDIPVSKTSSPDGNQSYQVWAAGNAELLNIVGLPQ